MTRSYVKKPVTVEAVQWDGTNKVEIQQFIGKYLDENTLNHTLIIPTLEGDHIASSGDYIIRGVNGEFYPCKPDIFNKTYSSGDEVPQNPTIEDNFSTHALNSSGIDKCCNIRESAKSLAYLIDKLVPDSREKSLAMTKLEEVMFWTNAGISRNKENQL